MRRLDLELKIHDYIIDRYEATYTGLLEVHVVDDIYKLILGIPSYMFPTVLSMDAASDDDFLEFIYSEFRIRNYMRTTTYKVIRLNDQEKRQ